MPTIDSLLQSLRNSPTNVSFSDLSKVCEHYFGKPRVTGGSHTVFKTPWIGDPRVNIQKSKGGKAKLYQVKQVLKAIDKLEGLSNEQ